MGHRPGPWGGPEDSHGTTIRRRRLPGTSAVHAPCSVGYSVPVPHYVNGGSGCVGPYSQLPYTASVLVVSRSQNPASSSPSTAAMARTVCGST